MALAWTAWVVQRQGFGEGDVTELRQTLTEVLGAFDEAYDDPDVVPVRAYLRDVAVTVTDGDIRREVLHRRSIAVSQAGARLDGHTSFGLDASDPGQRAALLRRRVSAGRRLRCGVASRPSRTAQVQVQ